MLSKMGQDQQVILDAGLTPAQSAAALAARARGIILSDVLLGLDEVGLQQHLYEKLDRLDSRLFTL